MAYHSHHIPFTKESTNVANINVPALAGSAVIPYGPYCKATEHYIGLQGTVGYLANMRNDGTADVNLRNLDSLTVPYVNAWLAAVGSTQKVEKYWRTKEYRVVSTAPNAPRAAKPSVKRSIPTVAAPAAPAVVAPVAPVTPEPTVEVAVTPQPVMSSVIPAPDPRVTVKHKRYDGAEYVHIGPVVTPVEDHATLEDALAGVRAGQNVSVVITGPSGTAKTLLVKAFAASVGLPFIKVDGGGIRTADDWFGALRQDPNTKTWAYQWSPFGTALRDGIECVVLLDEANRSETPAALNAALGLLDETGTHYVADAHVTLRKPKGMLVVVTANKGAEYVGTVPFDAAVTQRFSSGILLDYPPTKVETEVVVDLTGIGADIAARFVALAQQQRAIKDDLSQFPSSVGISTRMLVDTARRIVRSGTDPRAALLSCFAAQFDPGDRKALINILDSHFPPVANDLLDVDTEAINEG